MTYDLKTVTVRRTKDGSTHSQDEGKLEKAEAEGWERYDTQTYPDRFEHRLKRPTDYDSGNAAKAEEPTTEATTDDSSHNVNED